MHDALRINISELLKWRWACETVARKPFFDLLMSWTNLLLCWLIILFLQTLKKLIGVIFTWHGSFWHLNIRHMSLFGLYSLQQTLFAYLFCGVFFSMQETINRYMAHSKNTNIEKRMPEQNAQVKYFCVSSVPPLLFVRLR